MSFEEAVDRVESLGSRSKKLDPYRDLIQLNSLTVKKHRIIGESSL